MGEKVAKEKGKEIGAIQADIHLSKLKGRQESTELPAGTSSPVRHPECASVRTRAGRHWCRLRSVTASLLRSVRRFVSQDVC